MYLMQLIIINVGLLRVQKIACVHQLLLLLFICIVNLNYMQFLQLGC